MLNTRLKFWKDRRSLLSLSFGEVTISNGKIQNVFTRIWSAFRKLGWRAAQLGSKEGKSSEKYKPGTGYQCPLSSVLRVFSSLGKQLCPLVRVISKPVWYLWGPVTVQGWGGKKIENKQNKDWSQVTCWDRGKNTTVNKTEQNCVAGRTIVLTDVHISIF